MNWRHWLSITAAAFAGGVGTYVAQHLVTGIPTDSQALTAFVLGAAIAGAAAVAHLFQPSPSSSSGDGQAPQPGGLPAKTGGLA